MSVDPFSLPMPDLGLICLQCRYQLNGVPQYRCPECGWTFELNQLVPPGDWPEVVRLGKRVRFTPRVRDAMHRAQIPADGGDVMSNIFGGFSLSRGYLRVPRNFYFAALAVLAEMKIDGAPETSQVDDDEESQAEWTCSQCGEVNPANFEICFNCATPSHGDFGGDVSGE